MADIIVTPSSGIIDFYPSYKTASIYTSGNDLVLNNPSGDIIFSNISGSLGLFTSLRVSGITVSVSGHAHSTTDITNFASVVSGLLPVTNIIGVSGASVTSSGTIFTVAVTGTFGLTNSEIQNLLNSGVSINVTSGSGNFSSLQVAGVPVSVSGHTHTSSNITDFNSSVSGLLPVTNIVGTSGVAVTSSGTIFTISGTDEILEYDTSSNFPASGNENTVYVAKLTGQFYRWDGSTYYEHGPQGASTSTHASQHLTNGTDPIRLVEYTVPVFTANVNDLAHDNRDVLYLDADANNRELSGMVAPGFCCIKLLVNIDPIFSIILKNQSINSSTNNRFLIYTGSDYYLLPGQSVCVLYDTPSSQWRVL